MRMGIGLGVGINRSNYAQGIFNAYSARVVVDGGVTEGGSCVDAVSSLLKSASLLLVPSGYKGGKLYAEIPTNGNGDLTWTRGSDAFRTNADGLIQRVPWNLLQQSEDFSNAVWNKTNVTVSANTTTAPNGTTTADTLTTTATTGRHLLLYGDHSGTTITASIYVKKNTHNFIQIFTGWAGIAYANYDINNGVLGDVGSGTVASITNVGNGWYRCVFTSPAASASTIRWNLVTSSTAVYNESWTANGTESVFIWGAQLVEGTTAQTYLPTTDRLNFPRLSYTYGSCPSVLLEPQRTNLCLRSEEFDNAIWTKSASSITANTTTSPDGSANADTLTADGTLNIHFVTQSLTVTNGVTYSLSYYAKKNTNDFVQVFFNNGFGSTAFANFNINTGVIGTVGSSATATITNAGNGWYRCSITATATSTTTNNSPSLAIVNSNTAPIAQNNTLSTSVFLYGAQLEAGAYPTTYIPTTSATATRVADVYSRSLSSIALGTAFINITDNVALETPGTHVYGPFSITGASLGLYLSRPNGGRLRLWTAAANTVFQTTQTNLKLAITWDGTNVNVYQNGVKGVTNYAYALTNVNNLFSSAYLESSATIAKIVLFNSVLTDAECIALTT